MKLYKKPLIEWKVHYKTVCAENTEKKLESQVKLHKNIKVHKVICFTHTKVSTPSSFLACVNSLWTHTTDVTQAKV